MKWLENTVKMCLLLTILLLESFVKTGVRDLENDLFFWGHSNNNFVEIFEFERFCANLKNGSIDFFKTLNTRAWRCDQFYFWVLLTLIHWNTFRFNVKNRMYEPTEKDALQIHSWQVGKMRIK